MQIQPIRPGDDTFKCSHAQVSILPQRQYKITVETIREICKTILFLIKQNNALSVCRHGEKAIPQTICMDMLRGHDTDERRCVAVGNIQLFFCNGNFPSLVNIPQKVLCRHDLAGALHQCFIDSFAKSCRTNR